GEGRCRIGEATSCGRKPGGGLAPATGGGRRSPQHLSMTDPPPGASPHVADDLPGQCFTPGWFCPQALPWALHWSLLGVARTRDRRRGGNSVACVARSRG